MTGAGRQHGFVLLPVVLTITLVAAIAFLLNHENSINRKTLHNDMQVAQAEYVAQAGLNHALWQVQNSGCAGDLTLPSTPLGQHNYSATVTAPGAGTATTYTTAVDRDAWLKESSPDENHGADSELSAKNAAGDDMRALYRFDLSAIAAGSQVNSATAWFYVTSGDDKGPVNIHQVNADWTEAGATWNTSASQFDSVVQASIPTQSTSGVWVQVNLTALVQAWVNGSVPNYGIMLLATSDAVESKYTSREWGTGSERPWMEVVVVSGSVSPVNITATGTLASGVTRTLSRSAVKAYQPPNTLSLRPDTVNGKDAFLKEDAASNNHGVSTDLWVEWSGSGAGDNSLLQFDLNGIPRDAKIINATLELYQYWTFTPGGTVGVHRVNRDWVEGNNNGSPGTGATWNEAEPGTNWTTSGGDFDNTPVTTTDLAAWTAGPYTWEVTTLVQGWIPGTYPNQGLIMTAASAGTLVGFRSSDYSTVTQRPKLTIEYACECGSACLGPQGSGNLLFVVSNPWAMTDGETAKQSLFEAWGYTVTLMSQWDVDWAFDAAAPLNDVVYVSEAVDSTAWGLAPKLAATSLGVINEEGELNDELGIASSFSSPVGNSIIITDTSHYITQPFAAGDLQILAGAMEGLTVSGSEAGGLQTLADWGSAGALVVLDTGADLDGGGTAPGRRVMLPIGRDSSNFNWDYVNNNGRLIVQRALQWGTGNLGPIVSIPIILSTDSAATLGGLNFDDIDLAEYDPLADSATLFFEGALTTLTIDIDAIHVLENGHILLSTKDAATLGGLSFADGDLADYNPATDTAVLYFEESAFSADEDITSLYLMDNGHILLSTDSDATLGGLNFTDNDLVEYDPDSDTATLYFDGSTTTLTSDIDAVHVLENGHIVLSTKDDASLGGLSFKDGDLVDYDPVNDTAVLYFAEALFSAAEDVRSVHIGPGSGGNSVTLPIAHWKLDETSGPTAVDSEGGHDGTLAGNPTWSTGALDGALDFDGSGDRIDVGSILDGGSPQISVTAWIFKRDTGDDRVISKSSGTAIPDHIFSLGLYGTTIRVRLRTTDNGGTSNYDGGAISLDQWVHVAFTYDGAQLRIYRDGTETASYAVTGDMIASTQDIAIGNVNATDNRYWNGLLDDVRIYDTDLSASEVAELANPDSVTGPIAHWKLDETSGTTAVDSEGGHDGALTNGPVWTPGTIDGGLDFDGLNDRVSVGTIDVSGSGLTMMGWFNAETIPTSDGRIISKADGPNASDAWWQLSTTDSGSNRYIRMRIKAGGTTTTLADSSVNLTTNQWYFAAATYDNASAAMKLYLDGAEVANATHAVGGAVDTGPTVPVAIGANGTLERFFDGVLDDVRIYNRALNATEISDLFTSGGGGGGGPDPGGCNGTFRDEFDIKEYDQNNGTLNWSTNWEETGETTNPTGGDIRIDDDVSDYQLQVRDDGQTISREADLSGAGSATLSFDYRRESLNGSGDYVAVEVSYNGGTDWTELDRFTGTADDGSYTSSSHVLDAGSLSANTRIRFLTPNSGMNNNNMVWFDNIQIQCAP